MGTRETSKHKETNTQLSGKASVVLRLPVSVFPVRALWSQLEDSRADYKVKCKLKGEQENKTNAKKQGRPPEVSGTLSDTTSPTSPSRDRESRAEEVHSELVNGHVPG